jgi:predicted nucleic acid-binding protein
MTLVNTSSWIQYLRRDGEAEMKEKVRSLLLGGVAVLCPMIIAEFWMGTGSKKDQEDLTDLSAVLPCLPMAKEVWECSFRLARICRAKGTPVPSSDWMIESCAFSHGMKMLAKDKRFETLEGYRDLVIKGVSKQPLWADWEALNSELRIGEKLRLLQDMRPQLL